MESPVQAFSAFQNDTLFATPNFDEMREGGADDDFGYFGGVSSGNDSFMMDDCDFAQSWSQQQQHQQQSSSDQILDPLLGGSSLFSRSDLPFGPDAMFAGPELSPPHSASDDLDGEELFAKPNASSRRPRPRQKLPALDTRSLATEGVSHAKCYGQITPPASSKSPEAMVLAPASSTEGSKRGRKPSAKAQRVEQDEAKPAKGAARRTRKPAGGKAAGARRGRQQEAMADEMEAAAAEEEQTDEARAKRARFLERNRQAAFTCRQRKKQWAKDLEERHRTMERDNRNLKAARDSLQEEYRFLRRQLVSHTTCECSGARDYIQRASKVLEGLGSDGPVSPLASELVAGTPALEKTLRASLSQLAAADSEPLDPALTAASPAEDDESDGPELDGMTL